MPMPVDAEARILSALAHSEQRIMDRITAQSEVIGDLKGAVIRVEGRVCAMEGQCRLKHKGVDDSLATIRAQVRELRDDADTTGDIEVERLRGELKRRDDDRRKWVFWAVTAVVSILIGAVSTIVSIWKR